MDSDAWDERYRSSDLVWSAGPNQFLVDQVADLPPGRALDVACGEGRNALWLADEGWEVTATDFSPVAIDRARQLADERDLAIDLRVADATEPPPAGPHDLVLVFYLHLPPAQRRIAHRHAAGAVAPGGTLLVVGHDRENLERGVGGPQDPDLLLTLDGIRADLSDTPLTIEVAEQVTRDVEQPDGSTQSAIDALVRARRATSA